MYWLRPSRKSHLELGAAAGAIAGGELGAVMFLTRRVDWFDLKIGTDAA